MPVGSHYHFAEVNAALSFDRTAARSGPGQRREVRLVPHGGGRQVFGFNGHVMDGS